MNTPSRGVKNTQAFPLRELVQRSLSAIVIALLACALTYAGLWPFALLIAVGGIILAWEWGRMVRGSSADVVFFIHVASLTTACILTAMGAVPGALLSIIAGACAAAFCVNGSAGRVWSAGGVLYTGLASIILVHLRTDPVYAVAAVFFVYMIVWSADTSAYFTGRALGGPRLAPSVSPGKTWSGFAGGICIPALLAYLFALQLGATSPPLLVLAGILLALSSQLGDLAESAVKRAFNVKDAGQILPGHGGLFDRVDGLLGAALVAGCIVSLRDILNPGKALLIWP